MKPSPTTPAIALQQKARTSRSISEIPHDFRRHNTRRYNAREISRLRRYQYWILLIRHASECRRPSGMCKIKRCSEAKKVSNHIKNCRHGSSCQFPHCAMAKSLVSHYMQCSRSKSRSKQCLVCGPVKSAIKQHKLRDTLDRITCDFKCLNVDIDEEEGMFGCVREVTP